MWIRLAGAGVVAAGVILASGTARADGPPPGLHDQLSLGGDLQLIIPVGDLSNGTGPLIGVVARGGYRFIPPLEVTARIGYLAGLDKSQSTSVLGQTYTASSHLSNVPIWLGARYFFMLHDPPPPAALPTPAGLYAAGEIALNFMTASASGGGFSSSQGETRVGFNLGAGYVISPRSWEGSIDIRAQFSDLNLLGTNSGERAALGIGVSAGYTFFF